MQLHHLRREPSGARAVPGNGAASQAMPVSGPARAGLAAPGMAVQVCVMAGLLAGLWVAISPFILDAKFPITAAMYWSNVRAGGVIAALALGAPALGSTRATR
jgi:SPW repeat